MSIVQLIGTTINEITPVSKKFVSEFFGERSDSLLEEKNTLTDESILGDTLGFWMMIKTTLVVTMPCSPPIVSLIERRINNKRKQDEICAVIATNSGPSSSTVVCQPEEGNVDFNISNTTTE